MSVLLEVENLENRLNSRTVVDRVSFYMGKGQVMGMLGPNGAGKNNYCQDDYGCFYF